MIAPASFIVFPDYPFSTSAEEEVLERSLQECQSCSPLGGGDIGWCHGTCSSCSVNLIFLQSRIGGRLARAKII